MRVPISPSPANLVTEADPDLTDGNSYAVQNIGDAEVLFKIAAAEPMADDWDHVIPPNGWQHFEIDAATPPWLWTRRGVQSTVGVSDG